MNRFGAVSAVLVALGTAWAADNTAPREAVILSGAGGGDGRSAGSESGGSMGRPVLGYVAQSAPLGLRAILGVPGAATFGDPLPIPSDSSSVLVAPSQRFAWIERGGGAPAILNLGGTRAGNAMAVSGAIPVADVAAFSPSGSSLALYSAASGELQVLTGLPGTPQIAQDIKTSSLPGAPETLGISDDGGAVLLASGGLVYLLSSGGATQTVLTLSGSAAIAFLPGSRNAAVVDRGAGSLQLVRNGSSGVSSGVLATGLTGAADVSATGDGRSLVVTHPSSSGIGGSGSGIWMVNAGTGAVSSFSTPIAPAGLMRLANPLANQDSYLISSEPGQPAWIFVPNPAGSGGSGARTVFVPAAAPGRVPR